MNLRDLSVFESHGSGLTVPLVDKQQVRREPGRVAALFHFDPAEPPGKGDIATGHDALRASRSSAGHAERRADRRRAERALRRAGLRPAELVLEIADGVIDRA